MLRTLVSVKGCDAFTYLWYLQSIKIDNVELLISCIVIKNSNMTLTFFPLSV